MSNHTHTHTWRECLSVFPISIVAEGKLSLFTQYLADMVFSLDATNEKPWAKDLPPKSACVLFHILQKVNELGIFKVYRIWQKNEVISLYTKTRKMKKQAEIRRLFQYKTMGAGMNVGSFESGIGFDCMGDIALAFSCVQKKHAGRWRDKEDLVVGVGR